MTYRLLNEGEKILPTDEFYRTNDNTEVPGNGKWVAIGEMEDEYKEWYLPVRRAIEQPQIVESNQICDYCATEYASIACRGCQPVNGHAGFQGRKMAEVKE